jgi:hypothetical protein
VRWSLPTARVTVMGLPAMVAANPGPGPGICQSAEQIPQGAPIVGGMQARVFAM